MNKPFSYLLPVLVILAAFACLGVPERAVAQDYCYKCKQWVPDEGPPPEEEPEEDYFACRATEGLGFQACKLSRAGRQCTYTNDPNGRPDCLIVLDPVGRVHSAESPRPMQETALATNVLPEVARHGCSGAIVRRRYSSTRIAELRSGLRNVTI